MKKISRIITHVRPHLDEIAAIRLLQKHGEEEFPGVAKAKIEYWANTAKPEGKTWQEHMEEGTLLIGVGGGPFDEHPTFEEERKDGKSACQLVAEYLKLEKHPIYRRLIELVTEADQAGVHEFHIAQRLKTRYRLNPDDPQKAIDMVNMILDDWEQEQQLFVDGRLELQEMQNRNELHIVAGPNGIQVKLAAIDSDNYKMSAAARSLRIGILVQFQKNGHVQIFSDTLRNTISMKKVAATIRRAECLASGMPQEEVSALDAAALEKEGKTNEVPNWFYQIPGENLLNGAESAPDTPPTKIPHSLIIDIVKKYVTIGQPPTPAKH